MVSNSTSTFSQQSFQTFFRGVTLLSALFFVSLSHAQIPRTISNDQMTVECGYRSPVNGGSSFYLVEISLKKPSELNSTTALEAPPISVSVPLHTKIALIIDGQASSQEESYGFFSLSRNSWSQNEILSPSDSFFENFCAEESAPNIAGIIDGDSYYEEISPFPDPAKMPLIGSWFDNLSDNQLKKVPCIYSWSANQAGSVNLKLTGNIGCDKKESLLDYSGWKWNPKRNNKGDPVSVSLEIPITVVNEQDQKNLSQDSSSLTEASEVPLQD